MRKLTKGPKPTVLAANETAWTDEYTEAVTAGRRPFPRRYAHPDIRAVLSDETHKKCAYCESLIEPVAPSHVEHILPKSQRPDLVVSWPNLTIGCPTCNQTKGDYYSETEPLVNPYEDEPDEHLLFAGNLVFPRPGSDKGLLTIHRVGLSRAGLVQSRTDRLRAIHQLVDTWERAQGAEVKGALEEAIREEAGVDKEYHVAIREHLRQVGFPL